MISRRPLAKRRGCWDSRPGIKAYTFTSTAADAIRFVGISDERRPVGELLAVRRASPGDRYR
jgi:hypothetical protein